MIRNATLLDHKFILDLVLMEAYDGHFDRNLLIPAATRGLIIELNSILVSQVRLNGIYASALIWEINGEAIGFTIMSSGSDNKGNEFWMSAILPKYRGKGEGKRMVVEILNHFEGRNKILMARCAPESKVMFNILTTNGFNHVDTGKHGYRFLIYTL